MTITSVKQLNQHTCSLACIESLSIDKGNPITQRDLIDKYPIECRKGEQYEGAVSHIYLVKILIDLGFASKVVMGMGQAFLLAHQSNLEDGIFLNTTLASDGKTPEYHTWRLERFLPDGLAVVEPSQSCSYPYIQFPWGYLQHRGCIAAVCIP